MRLFLAIILVAFLCCGTARAAITFGATTKASCGPGACTATVNVPAGTVNGDVMLMFETNSESGASCITPTGWTVITSNTYSPGASAACAWYRIASSEPASYTTPSGSGYIQILINDYHGVSTTASPINASANSFTLGHTNTTPAPTETPVAGEWYVGYASGDGTTGGMTNTTGDLVHVTSVAGSTNQWDAAVGDKSSNTDTTELWTDTNAFTGIFGLGVTLKPSTPPAPVVTGSLTASGTVGTAFSYTITATNTPTSFSASPLPAGLSINTATGVISGTPTAPATTNVSIGATNGSGTGTATLVVTIGQQRPAITSALTASGTINTAFSYTITGTNNPTSFSASPLPAGLSINTVTGVISGTPTTPATTNVTLGATNSGGTGNATLVVTIVNQTPVITSSLNSNATVGSSFNYIITATNSPTSFNATPLPGGLSVNTSTGTISGTLTTAATTNVTLSATNSVGTGTATLVVVISPPSTGALSIIPICALGTPQGAPCASGYKWVGIATIGTLNPLPTITSALTAGGTVGAAFSYAITATNSPTIFNATGLPSPLVVNTSSGIISGTPTAASSTNIPISATNVAGSGNATLALTINSALQPPVVNSSLTASGMVSTAFSYQITATNSPTSYNATSLPGGLIVNTSTGAISGTPTVAGTTNVALSAINAAGTGTATLVLTINNIPVPVVTSSLTASGTVGTSLSYAITATNSPTSFNATPLPAGLSVNTATGVISGTPTTAGTTNVTMSATNAGGTGTATLALTINSSQQPPIVTSSLSAAGSVGALFSYQITASNSPTSFNATNLPGGLSVNTANGLISGTPTTAATMNVPISATNSVGTGTATLVVTITNLAPGFYVATNGSDSNIGTLAAPFATMGKCQTAMRGSSTNKTCYFRAGSYAPAGLSACNSRGNCAISLSSPADNGETWSYYPPDGVDSADITGGSTASGNGLWGIISAGNAAHVTINGLSLHNFDFAAIMSTGGDPTFLTVTNNVIFNGFALVGDPSLTGAQSASGFMCYDCTDLTVSNNVVHDMASFGITNDHSSGPISNYLVANNVLYNICTGIRDCGAIYSQDLASTSTNLHITNNYVRDGAVFDTAGWGAGIYLDDCTNNYVVNGNILTGENGGNNIMIHGGSNNVFSNNIIDLAAFGNPILREQSSSCPAPTGNSFKNNIIVAGAGIGGYNGVTGTVTVTANAYWNYGTGTLNSNGDANPTVENPLFSCLGYNVASGSPVFNSPVNFVAPAGGWGPPGYTIPPTGTAPSTTRGCAIASNTFLSSLGVNIHHSQGYSEAAYEPQFIFTGIRNARDRYVASDFVTLHNNTVTGTYPGVKMDIIEDAPSTIVSEGTALAAAGAFLSAEGPNEPNNEPLTYLGNPGGGNTGTWVPVAQLQRDLYAAVKGSALSAFPVFNVSESGAEVDNVGLQCNILNSSCAGASSVTLMAANTAYADYANPHNYVQGNPGCDTPHPNQAWNAEDPLLNSCWDAFYGDYVVTWRNHFNGYSTGQAPTAARVTTETGWESSAPSTTDYQGKIDLMVYLDAYKRGWSYTFIYEMVDQQGSAGNQGLFDPSNVAKPAATFIHNMTTVLADTTNFTPHQLNYSIASEPATVHDMLLQKSNGKFELVIWDEQTTSSTTDNITVTFGAAATVKEYDTTVGTSPINTFTNTTSIPLTLSDHAIILEIQ